MEQKFDIPDLFFWASAFTYIQFITMEFQKKISWLRDKMESVERRQSSVIIKISLIRSFYILEQKIDPHLDFWTLAFTYIPIIPKKFQTISWGQAKMENVEKRESSVIIKIFLV